MPHDPDEPDWLAEPPTVAEAIEDLRGVIDDFDDVRPDEMTDFFYVHAYNMLIETARTLVQTLDDAGLSQWATEWP